MPKKTNDSYNFDVPWTPQGVPWSDQYRDKTKTIWKPNEPFKAGMKVTSLFRQSTSTYLALMVDQATGQQFVMRSEEFLNAILNTTPIFGLFVGTWRFKKTSKHHYCLEFLGRD